MPPEISILAAWDKLEIIGGNMKVKALRIICVGKIKTACWKEASAHYLALLYKWRSVQCIEVKDGSASLEVTQRLTQESKNILEHITEKDIMVVLSETGKTMTSRQFAQFLRNLDEKEQRRLNFIVGGPFGLDSAILQNSALAISLSSMTFPHELARVLLLEQLFRAECILHNFPYHH